MNDGKIDIDEVDFSFFQSEAAANISLETPCSGQETEIMSAYTQGFPGSYSYPSGQTTLPSNNNNHPSTNEFSMDMARQYKEIQKRQTRVLKDNAFKKVFLSEVGVYAIDEYGCHVVIIASGIEYCKFVQTDSNYKIRPFYAIKFRKYPNPLIISKSELLNKTQFSQFLVQQLHIDITIYPYRARLLTALQNFFRDTAVCIDFPFYYGWLASESHWEYTVFASPMNTSRLPSRTTHGSVAFDWKNCLDCIIKADSFVPVPMNTSVQLTAVNQAITSMDVIHNGSLRKLLWLLLHIASLYSLLLGTKNKVPYGFCFFSENERTLSPLKELFSWFQDDPIKITEGKNRFVTLLTERKDEPLLLLDSEGQISNSKLLEQGIDTGYVECGKKAHELHALPIVLSNMLSHITRSKRFICFNVDDDDISLDANRIFSDNYDYLMEYLHYFNLFVQEQQKTILSEQFAPAVVELFKEDMTESCCETLRLFRAIEKIVVSYYQSLHPSEEYKQRIDNLFSEDIDQFLVSCLKQTINHDDNTTIKEVFFATANRMIQEDLFDIRTFDRNVASSPCAEDKNGIIYIYENEPCLCKDAFDLIVAATGYGPHAVVGALRTTNAFSGAPISVNAPQYRLPITNPSTKKSFTPVYRFPSDSITLFAEATTEIEKPRFKDPAECNFTIQLGASLDNRPIIWNGTNNSHICISGATGSGKSYFLKKIIAQLPHQGVRCIIFDTSGDFSDISKENPENWPINDLEIVNMEDTQAQSLFFKPLSANDSMDKAARRFIDALHRRYTLGKNQKDNLYHHITDGARKKRPTNFPELIASLEYEYSYPQLIGILKQLNSIIPFGNVPFNWKMNVPGITVLNFHNGNDDNSLKTVIELLLSTICATRMYVEQKPQPPVVLVFDECQLYDWRKGSYAYDIVVRGRKYALAGWLSTQALKLINNPEILEQADLRVFFKPTDKEIGKIVNGFCLTNAKEKVLWKSKFKELVRGQFICEMQGQILQSQVPSAESQST